MMNRDRRDHGDSDLLHERQVEAADSKATNSRFERAWAHHHRSASRGAGGEGGRAAGLRALLD